MSQHLTDAGGPANAEELCFRGRRGGLAVWLWRDRIEAYLTERTRAVRERMADRMQAMENKTGAANGQ